MFREAGLARRSGAILPRQLLDRVAVAIAEDLAAGLTIPEIAASRGRADALQSESQISARRFDG